MKLLSATPSPYARKVRIALAEKGLRFELLTEVPWDADASAPAYNPLGKIPVLILDDGEAVFESSFILEWLEAKHPEPPLLPADIDARLAVGSALGYLDLRLPDFDWALRHPALADWFARISERPSFAATLPQAQGFKDRVV